MTNDKELDELVGDLRPRLGKVESRSPKRWRLATLILLGALVSLPLVADALGPVPHIFVDGAVISAVEMNENFAHLEDGITAAEEAVPTGAVMFDLATCPVGWAEVTEARGRTIVGMPGSAGTLRGMVGTALSDLEDRMHTHAVNTPAFTSGSRSIDHSHSSGSLGTSSDAHNHAWYNSSASYNSTGSLLPLPIFPLQVGADIQVASFGTNLLYTNNDVHSHTINSGSVGTSTRASTAHDHVVDPPNSASTPANTAAVIPYIQFLVCVRT